MSDKDSAREVRMGALERDVERLKAALGTAIVWIAQSAVAPISALDARRLLDMLRDTPEAGDE